MKTSVSIALLIVVVILLAGCEERDQRLVDFAQRATAEQAQQNRDVVRANESLIQAHQALSEREADARQELTAWQRQISKDQAEVAQQRDLLEAERASMATQRQRESTWGAIFLSTSLVLAALAPLVLAGTALWIAWRSPPDELCGQVVLEDLTSPSSLLLRHSSSGSRLEPGAMRRLEDSGGASANSSSPEPANDDHPQP